jgi:hypothetical protein
VRLHPQNLLVLAGLFAITTTLSACAPSGMSIRDLVSDESTEELVGAEPIVSSQPMSPLPTGDLTAADITRAMAERRFSFVAVGSNGTITYFKDGTFEYIEAGKGSGTGIWQATDGKLCEARNPTTFLPKGAPSTCSKITSDGSRLTIGAIALTPI